MPSFGNANSHSLLVLSLANVRCAPHLREVVVFLAHLDKDGRTVDVTLPSTTLPAAPTALKMGFDGYGVFAGR